MFVKSMKSTISALTILSSLSSLAYAGKTEILRFSSSEQDPETGKAIMKMIRKANPSYFHRDAEQRTNRQGKPAYTLWSNGQGEGPTSHPKVTYSSTSVNLKEGFTETSLWYMGSGYRLTLELKMSGKLLTDKGKAFFCKRAKENGTFIKK
jgi:hypothetical protein